MIILGGAFTARALRTRRLGFIRRMLESGRRLSATFSEISMFLKRKTLTTHNTSDVKLEK